MKQLVWVVLVLQACATAPRGIIVPPPPTLTDDARTRAVERGTVQVVARRGADVTRSQGVLVPSASGVLVLAEADAVAGALQVWVNDRGARVVRVDPERGLAVLRAEVTGVPLPWRDQPALANEQLFAPGPVSVVSSDGERVTFAAEVEFGAVVDDRGQLVSVGARPIIQSKGLIEVVALPVRLDQRTPEAAFRSCQHAREVGAKELAACLIAPPPDLSLPSGPPELQGTNLVRSFHANAAPRELGVSVVRTAETGNRAWLEVEAGGQRGTQLWRRQGADGWLRSPTFDEPPPPGFPTVQLD